MREFWELVIQKKELDFEGEPENFLRQAFSSEKFAKDRAEEDPTTAMETAKALTTRALEIVEIP